MTNNNAKVPNPDIFDTKEGVHGFAESYPAGTLIKEHAHSGHQIVHATKGAMRVSAENGVWFLPPGRALWVPAHIPHAIWCEGRVEMRTVYLDGDGPCVYTDLRVLTVSPLLRETMVRLTQTCSEPLVILLRDILLIEIQAAEEESLRIPIPSDRRISAITGAWQSEPSDNRTLTDWAKQLGFSQRNLIRAIRTETGMTFRELRRQTRVMVSIERLSKGQAVTSVALDVGFETPSAFIQAFRTVTGLTPKKFFQ
jgi:AraC-like DNA-binding protein